MTGSIQEFLIQRFPGGQRIVASDPVGPAFRILPFGFRLGQVRVTPIPWPSTGFEKRGSDLGVRERPTRIELAFSAWEACQGTCPTQGTSDEAPGEVSFLSVVVSPRRQLLQPVVARDGARRALVADRQNEPKSGPNGDRPVVRAGLRWVGTRVCCSRQEAIGAPVRDSGVEHVVHRRSRARSAVSGPGARSPRQPVPATGPWLSAPTGHLLQFQVVVFELGGVGSERPGEQRLERKPGGVLTH